ncbi:MAG TPA: glycoside hydrolase family 15 protein [Solirubrobacteraceae bacterium]|nr:glycoside hydrolase family 15 protein [Solirubrobacteraceae bacterium]
MSDAERYLPIGDYALIGDCHTAALVAKRGSIDWCCLPRFDGGSAFGRLLDADGGGHCSLTALPEDGQWETTREYLNGTLVLATTIQGPTGEVRIFDSFARRDPDSERGSSILRVIEGRRGTVELELQIVPRFDYGAVRPWIRRHDDRLHSATGGNDALVIWCDRELVQEPEHELTARFTMHHGERVRLSLTYTSPERVGDGSIGISADDIDTTLQETIDGWREWSKQVQLDEHGFSDALTSAMVLKALTYEPTGAIVAAPTTSLPETLGGVRNWDYRYAWVRDASFSSRAFAEVGCEREADAFRSFVMRSAAGHAEDLQVLYGAGGERRLDAVELDGLEGYGGAAPVRTGNAASGQRQLDAYGEIVNLTWRWHRRGHSPDDDQWRFLSSLIDRATEQCGEPDSGIWEWPGEPEHFVHSKVVCWSALDRGLRLAEECMRRAPTRRWTKTRNELAEEIESRGYDERRGIYVQAYDRPELDAALLLLPTIEYVAWDDERMLRTVDAIREELGAGGGLLYRYRRKDGLPGQEGAFVCCSFWLVECLARAGDIGDARDVYERALQAANDLGLFSEEVDPKTGELLGNFPQGLSHLAHIAATVALAECERSPHADNSA